jgi:hypothetical protein
VIGVTTIWAPPEGAHEAGELFEARSEEIVERGHRDLRRAVQSNRLVRRSKTSLDEAIEVPLLSPDLDDSIPEVGRVVKWR